MGDLKWVTLGFIHNFIEFITGDKMLSSEEKQYFSDSAQKIVNAVELASSDEDEENYHHAFHHLRGKVCVAKLRRHILNRNNNQT